MATRVDATVLDHAHLAALESGVRNVLSLDIAETVFAEILDGLPTLDGLRSMFGMSAPPQHPSVLVQHTQPCPGFLSKARDLRHSLRLSDVTYDAQLLYRFQNSVPTTKEYQLRLLELVALTCHDLAGDLYAQGDVQCTHPRHVYQEWYEEMNRNGTVFPVKPCPVAFAHYKYRYPSQLPRGELDVVGYWAEARIFGGVLLFDRGDSEEECNNVYLHGEYRAPATLYPPTSGQLNALMALLLADTSSPETVMEPLRYACPLPVRGRPYNRPRWDVYEAVSKYHIFRDKYAFPIPERRYFSCTTLPNACDWPELNFRDRPYPKEDRSAYDAEELVLIEATKGLRSPTSPTMVPEWYQNAVFNGRGPGSVH